MAQNYGLERVIGFDETGFRGTADLPYRTEAWDFLIAGGAGYSNLDYSYSAAHPDGTAKVTTSPGGGGPELRKQLAILKGFMDGLDFVRMKPDNAVVKDGRIAAPLAGGDKGAAREAKATVRALVEPGKAYAVYVKGGVQADVLLDLPRGKYRAEWLNTKTGAVDKAEDFDHDGGTRKLVSPAYEEDVALQGEVRSSTERIDKMSNELARMVEALRREEEVIRQGGGAKAIARQHEKGRLTARERIGRLLDPGADFFELGLWAAYGMYRDWGGAPSAGVVTGIGTVAGRTVMIIANDATVKAGAFFPMTCKKVLRAQRIALENRLPLVYLVDCAGVFLPLQDEVFPDEDDFGRIFRNNAVISAAGVPQFAAILGNCVAGGGYLPVLCDKLLMTEGSGLYLAGPALVKAAIGQTVSHEDLGGAAMHAAVSGTIDFREPNDEACLERLRRLVGLLRRSRPPACQPQSPPAGRRPTCCTCSRRRHGRNTTSAICCRACSTPGRSTSTRRNTARRWCAATAGSAAIRSAWWPTSASAAARRRGRCSSAASSTWTAPTRRRGSSWTATRRACRCCSCRT